MGAEIVTIGETMILLYGEDTTAPLRFGEPLMLDFAGADSNFAIAMSRLGYRAAWISRLGDEPLGELVLNAIAREGVDVSRVIRDPTRMMRPESRAFSTTVAARRQAISSPMI